ncbi:MAG TPA: ribonuclease domain-containing protein [Nocardia sp.]|uniref:ribonuclease domain-containing protein n=1 Tax=Nocardia TaxID=1817 RepID=UPI00245773E8|nr:MULTISPECIES: ribonuclease domain-containing protein [Nocardia]HLS77470.1 ribonuclease domain-containing protein [Nocardia sp.]
MNPKALKTVAGVGALALILLLSLLTTRGADDTASDAAKTTTTATASAFVSGTGTTAPKPDPGNPVTAESRAPGVPDRAYATLAEIDAGRWPDSANAPGTKGGERFMNRDKDLPLTDSSGRPITYQEWDVNPKQRNRSRDAERIVTGSDGSAWYTGDHYETFTRMR